MLGMFATPMAAAFARPPFVMDESGALPSGAAGGPASGADIGPSRIAPAPQNHRPATGMFGPAQRPQLPNNSAGLDPAASAEGKKGHKGLFPGKDWKTIVPMIANALLAFSARNNPASMAMLQNNMAMMRDRQEAQQRLALEEARAKLPQQVGSSLVQPDGTGGYQTLYSEPSDAERYASTIGYEAGTPEWVDAVREYRAPAWGPMAMQGKEQLEGVRYGYRDALQGDRLEQSDINNRRSTSTSRENNIRSTGVSRENSIRSTGQSNTNSQRTSETQRRGQDVRSKDYRESAGFQGRGKGGAGSGDGAVAELPDGRKIVVRNGKWVDAKSGQPIQ